MSARQPFSLLAVHRARKNSLPPLWCRSPGLCCVLSFYTHVVPIISPTFSVLFKYWSLMVFVVLSLFFPTFFVFVFY